MDSLDEKVMNELKDLMGDDYTAVYKIFISSTEEGLEKLKKAVSDINIEDVETITHTLKGSSANTGAKKLSQLSMDMLEDSRRNKTDNFEMHLKLILDEFNKVSAQIAGLLNSSP